MGNGISRPSRGPRQAVPAGGGEWIGSGNLRKKLEEEEPNQRGMTPCPRPDRCRQVP